MFKKLLLLSVLFTLSNSFAQHSVVGKMKPINAKYTWLILYKLNGVNQKYIGNGDIKNGAFTVDIPKGSEAGMYRLLYDNANNKFIDFIYNNEDVSMEFHPDYPLQLVKFDKSKENILYQKYIDQTAILQNKLDSLQVVYFKTKDKSHEEKLNKFYHTDLKKLKAKQSNFETESKNTIAQHFIIANKRFYADNLIKDTQKYLNTIKTHYFDYVNFNDVVLKKSSLLIDRVMDFVFYLNTSNDPKTLLKLRKEGVDFALNKITEKNLKKDVIESLLYTFAQQENIKMVDYLLKTHFAKLPVGLQDYEFKEMIMDMLKTTIGNKAPEITWQEKGKTKNLYGLKDKKYYLVVFWSSTCPHCLKEMPLLHKYLEDKKDIEVIAVALETKVSKIGWVDEKYYYDMFTHVLALSTDDDSVFRSKYVKDYGVNATPNFFLLDANKTIIAKPYDVKELKKVYKKLHLQKNELKH